MKARGDDREGPGRLRLRRATAAAETSAGGPPSFRARTLAAVRSIPFGEVRPYLWVAKEAGSPGAARAVGRVLRQCPSDVPWHRTVGRDGTARCPGRQGVQVARLEAEGPGWRQTVFRARSGHVVCVDAARGVYCYPSCHSLAPGGRGLSSAARAQEEGLLPCPACRPV